MPVRRNQVTAVVLHLVVRCMRGLVWLYQACISPFLGAQCRHLPTCSHYAKEAFDLHGPLRGLLYALKRILRCHPWAVPMFDPVPPLQTGETKIPDDKHANRRCSVR